MSSKLKSSPFVEPANPVAVLGCDIKVTLAICIIVVVLCIIRRDRSQPLFYFVPQEKEMIRRPPWGQGSLLLILRRGSLFL